MDADRPAVPHSGGSSAVLAAAIRLILAPIGGTGLQLVA